jgi:hypothetical protein
MIVTLLSVLLAGAGGQAAALPSEGALCSLAESLLLWSPPISEQGCVLPFAMDCGRKGLFAADGRPVVRFRYRGDERATWAFPNAPCGARGIWLYKTGGEMPPGAGLYLQVFLERIRPREIKFDLTLGGPPEGTLGCGEFHGIARYVKGKWKLFLTHMGPPRIQDNPSCRFTKEQVFHCNEGGPTSR